MAPSLWAQSKEEKTKAARAAAFAAREAAFIECLKGLDGHYVVRAPDIPANPGGRFNYAHALVEVGPDGSYGTGAGERTLFGTLIKGELVRLTLDVKTPTEPTIIVQTVYQHNVIRGGRESAEPLRLHIKGKSFRVPCEALTGVVARLFEKADDGAVAGRHRPRESRSRGLPEGSGWSLRGSNARRSC